MTPPSGEARWLPPRVLIVMAEQWPRALLRAALREIGYDAIGARTLAAVAREARPVRDRGPLRLIVLDQRAIRRDAAEQSIVERVLSSGQPETLLLARTTEPVRPGPWRLVLRRPLSVADIVSAVEKLVPLPIDRRQPVE